jgi:hypothetical protein
MKLPNFRLHETQATTSMYLGIAGWLSLAALAAVVLKNFNTTTWTILYNEQSTLGQYRRGLVMLFCATTLLIGGVAALMGFSSLGQKRNNRQGRSWIGMLMGAVALAVAPVLFITWQRLSEVVIQSAK